jgi:hypothetical protein
MNGLLAAMQERVNCAQNTKELAATDSQQLKAEIAALIPKLESINTVRGWEELCFVVKRLRQLSAV